MGSDYSARIAHFLSTRFPSHRTGSSKVEVRSLQKFLLVRAALFLLGAAIPSPTLAQAKPHKAAVFHFSKGIHMGDAVLPPGDYIVTSLDVRNTGAVITVAAPTSQPRSSNSGAHDLAPQEVVSDDSVSDEGLLTIHNLHNQTVPYTEVQAIYLSACKVVDQEFSRTNAVRPRLTLVLGGTKNRVYYPDREIQLTKWDNYQFAEGVVLLAVADLLPDDEKMSLAKLAVLGADSIVDIRELKSSQTALRAGPRN